MKPTLMLTTLFGAAIASPVAIANVKATEVQERDIEPRVLSILTNPIRVSASLSIPTSTPLPSQTAPTGDPTSLTMAMKNILLNAQNANAGMGGGLSLPNTNALSNNPVASIANGSITIDQLRTLINNIVTQVLAAIGLGQNLSPDLSTDQLKQVATIFDVIQQVLTALKSLPNLTSPNGVSGADVPLNLQPLLDAVSGILNNIAQSLTGATGGLIGGLTNFLSSLLGNNGMDDVLSGLPSV